MWCRVRVGCGERRRGWSWTRQICRNAEITLREREIWLLRLQRSWTERQVHYYHGTVDWLLSVAVLQRQTFEDDKVAFLKEQFLDSSVFNSTSECKHKHTHSEWCLSHCVPCSPLQWIHSMASCPPHQLCVLPPPPPPPLIPPALEWTYTITCLSALMMALQMYSMMTGMVGMCHPLPSLPLSLPPSLSTSLPLSHRPDISTEDTWRSGWPVMFIWQCCVCDSCNNCCLLFQSQHSSVCI